MVTEEPNVQDDVDEANLDRDDIELLPNSDLEDIPVDEINMDIKLIFQNGNLIQDPEEIAHNNGIELDEYMISFIRTQKDFSEQASQEFVFKKELKKLISPSGRYELIKLIGFHPGYPVEKINDHQFYDTKSQKYRNWDRLSYKNVDYLVWNELYRILPNGGSEMMDSFTPINLYGNFNWVEGHPDGYDYLISETNGVMFVMNMSTNTRLIQYLPAYVNEDLFLHYIYPSPDKQFLIVQIEAWGASPDEQLWDFSHPLLFPYPVLEWYVEDDYYSDTEYEGGEGWKDDTHYLFCYRLFLGNGESRLEKEMWDMGEAMGQVKNLIPDIVQRIRTNLPLTDFQKTYPYLRTHVGYLSDVCAMYPTDTAKEVQEILEKKLRVGIGQFDIIL